MEWLELTASDGHRLQACVARPRAPRGALVVLQEIFGVNAHIRSLCDRFAAEGWLAIAPALFDRVAPAQSLPYDASGVARGREIRSMLSDSHALRDVQAAIDWANAQPGTDRCTATIGFCWGGTLSWLAAARLEGVRGSVCYYGTGIAGYVEEAPKVPVLMHFGDMDANIPAADVDLIARTWPGMALHRYGAGHGFNCDDRAAFHPPSAELSAARTDAFLNEVVCRGA